MPRTAPPMPDQMRGLFGLSRLRGHAPEPFTVNLSEFRTITAAPEVGRGGRWQAVLVVEGVRTTDNREIARGALTWRDLPLPLMALDMTTWGHDSAVLVGVIETITYDEATGRYLAEGYYLADENGQRFEALVAERALRWVSVDLEVTASRVIEVYDDAYFEDDAWWEDDWAQRAGLTAAIWIDDYDWTTWWEQITEGRIMGATVCPFPAFPQALIAPEGMAFEDVSADNGLPTLDLPANLRASGEAVDLLRPPAWWFEDPALPGPTHLTVCDDGRVYGHVATWDTRHVGMPGQVTPPRNGSGYAYFRTGTVRAVDAEGNDVDIPTGVLSMGGGHADGRLGYRPAADHYDSTSTGVADLAAGEDAYGIWVAGALRPGVSGEQLRTLRASDVSGDWRKVGASMEMMAVLVVNVPGFPIPRSLAASGAEIVGLPVVVGVEAGFVSGQQVSLVAAGVINNDPMGEMIRAFAKRLAAVEAITEPLRGQAIDALSARMGVAPAAAAG